MNVSERNASEVTRVETSAVRWAGQESLTSGDDETSAYLREWLVIEVEDENRPDLAAANKKLLIADAVSVASKGNDLLHELAALGDVVTVVKKPTHVIGRRKVDQVAELIPLAVNQAI